MPLEPTRTPSCCVILTAPGTERSHIPMAAPDQQAQVLAAGRAAGWPTVPLPDQWHLEREYGWRQAIPLLTAAGAAYVLQALAARRRDRVPASRPLPVATPAAATDPLTTAQARERRRAAYYRA